MFRHALWAWVLALAAVCLAAAGAARAADPPIKDEAGLFTAGAVRQATEAIQEMRRTEHKDLVIETYPGVPEDRAKAFAGMTRKQREDFFLRWADERARAREVDGVYVLLCKSPATTEVVLGPDTEDRVFPERERARLARTLPLHAWRKNYDAELRDAVGLVRSSVAYNLRAGGPQDASQTWLWAGGIIGGLLLVWLVIGLLRAALGLRVRPAPAEAAGAPCESHPFVSGMLGGMFGARAGHWVCDSLLGPARPAGDVPTAPAESGGPPPTGGGVTGAPLPDEEAYAASPGEGEGPDVDDGRSELERRAEDY
jgi:hypothetical protein